MPELSRLLIDIVKEYFSQLDDREASNVLWHLTGWPSTWNDCDETCKGTAEDTERHLRHDLRIIKHRLTREHISFEQQKKDFAHQLKDMIRELETKLQQEYSNLFGAPENSIPFLKGTLIALRLMDARKENKKCVIHEDLKPRKESSE